MRVCFVNCRRSRFAVLTAKSNKTATMENESLYLLVTNYVTCTNVWIFFFFCRVCGIILYIPIY